jgi:DNA-directed RNA polymerase subunit RPC12/RpoP
MSVETRINRLERTVSGECSSCSSEYVVVFGTDGEPAEDTPLTCEECGRSLLVDIGGPSYEHRN